MFYRHKAYNAAVMENEMKHVTSLWTDEEAGFLSNTSFVLQVVYIDRKLALLKGTVLPYLFQG